MSNFCERLKEARKHLKLNQGAFGALAGVSAETQLNYEKGSRKPDSSYLEAVAAHGVDVAYLLTGLRSLDPCAAPHPNPGQTLAERLQQERKRLELTVGQLADKSGVDRLALLKFEEGEFAPDAKALQQLHAVGVDVGYVLLSLRAGGGGVEAGALPSDAQALLQHYQQADEEAQAALRTLAARVARA
ncbi:XRE family transcriptional regulator [Delftia sp. 670]|nr:XRE family transcriptional regulator [Delftia sp. 670]